MIRIPETIYHAMVEHARREWPLECCGILSGREKTVEKAFQLRNAEESPVRYSISPLDQLRAFEEMEKESKEMVAIYHSHTHTIPFPSETDVRMAFYPEVATIIISLKKEENPLIKAFRIGKEAIYLEEIEVISPPVPSPQRGEGGGEGQKMLGKMPIESARI
jgi:proteasome lid subunit RPN8/RPN11